LTGKKSYEPDWKTPKRVKNPKAMKAVHAKGCVCVLNCGRQGHTHHLIFRSQGGPDENWNLACLCRTHHDLIHAEDDATRTLLGQHLVMERPDALEGIRDFLGAERGNEWLTRRLNL
jgi:hypothetical protein